MSVKHVCLSPLCGTHQLIAVFGSLSSSTLACEVVDTPRYMPGRKGWSPRGGDYGFFARDKEETMPILCVKCKNKVAECLGASVLDKQVASDYATSFLTAFIMISGFKRMLVTSGFIVFFSILPGVELVLMARSEWPRGGRCP